MQTLIFKGLITDVFPVERPGGTNFKKRVFWVEDGSGTAYQLEAWNDDTDALPIVSNQTTPVVFHVEIRGKRWQKNGREGVINTLRCVGIHKDKPAEEYIDKVDDLPF